MVIRGKTTRDFWKRIKRGIATRGRRVEGADARGVLSSIQEFSGFIPEHSHLCIFPFFIAFFWHCCSFHIFKFHVLIFRKIVEFHFHF